MTVDAPPTSPAAAGPDTAGPADSVVAKPPRIRRRGLAGIGIAIVAASGLGGAALYTTTTDTHAVLAVTEPIMRGSTVTADALVAAQITLDPALQPIAAGEIDQVVGMRAAFDLPPGTIVTADSLTEGTPPAAGEELVGLAVRRAQLPAEPLLAGDVVHIVDTPREQDDPPTSDPRSSVATVVTVGEVDETGHIVIDVTVTEGEGPALAARAATGRIAIILQSRQRN